MSKEKKSPQPNKNFIKKNKLMLIFLAVYILLSILLFDPKLFTGGDNAVYTILAESIAGGKGYRNLHMPDEPAHTQYPFGFPLFISPFVLVFGSSLFILKFVLFLTGLGSLYFMFKIVNSLFKDNANIVIPFYLSVPIFIIYNHWILSEMPFLFFSLGALYFFMKAKREKEIFYYIAFIFATYAFFIRTAGISLIIGILFFLIIKKQFKYVGIFLLIFLIVFIPWQIRTSSISSEGTYIDQLLAKNPYQMELGRIGFFGLLGRVWKNFVFYAFTILPMTLIPVFKPGSALAIPGLIFILFAVIGFIRKIKKFTIIESYFTLGVIILLGWPKVWSSDRFLLPILPILIIYIFFGIFWLGEKVKLKYFAPVVTGILIILNIAGIFPMVKTAATNNISYMKGNKYAGYTGDWIRYFELIEWIKEHIPEDNIIMARKPSFVYLLSKRKSFIYPYTTDHKKVKDAIRECDYILFDNFYWTGTTQRYLLPVLRKEPGNYEVIHETRKPQFYLLKPKNNL